MDEWYPQIGEVKKEAEELLASEFALNAVFLAARYEDDPVALTLIRQFGSLREAMLRVIDVMVDHSAEVNRQSERTWRDLQLMRADNKDLKRALDDERHRSAELQQRIDLLINGSLSPEAQIGETLKAPTYVWDDRPLSGKQESQWKFEPDGFQRIKDLLELTNRRPVVRAPIDRQMGKKRNKEGKK